MRRQKQLGMASACSAAALLALTAFGIEFAEVKTRIENAKTPDYKAIEVLRSAAAGLKDKEFIALGISVCADALKNEDMMTRIYAARALGAMGSPDAIPTLTDALKDQDVNVRIEALRSLGMVGNASVLPLLAGAAESKDNNERDTARSSIKAMPGDDVSKAMLDYAKNTGEKSLVRVEMIGALAERGVATAIPELIEIARNDKDDKTRAACIQALGKLADIGSAGVLLELMENAKTDDERSEAATALSTIIVKAGTPKAEIDKITAKLEKAQPPVRRAMLKTLNLAGWPNAKETVDGLAGGEFVPTLLGVVKNAKADDERNEAADAMAAIVRRAGAPEDEVQSVVSEMEDAEEPALKVALAGALAFIGGESAINAVDMWFDDVDAKDDEKSAVIARLGKASDLTALTVLGQRIADIDDGIFEAKLKPAIESAYMESAISLAKNHEEAQEALKKIKEKAVAADNKDRAKKADDALVSEWVSSF